MSKYSEQAASDACASITDLDDIAEMEVVLSVLFNRAHFLQRQKLATGDEAGRLELVQFAHRLRCILDRSPRIGTPEGLEPARWEE